MSATWLADVLLAEEPKELNLGQEQARGRTIAATLRASPRPLDHVERLRYLEVGVFAEDTDIGMSLRAFAVGRHRYVDAAASRRLVAESNDQSLVSARARHAEGAQYADRPSWATCN